MLLNYSMVLQLIKSSSFFSLLFFALLPFQACSRSVYFAYSANADGMAYLSAAGFRIRKNQSGFFFPFLLHIVSCNFNGVSCDMPLDMGKNVLVRRQCLNMKRRHAEFFCLFKCFLFGEHAIEVRELVKSRQKSFFRPFPHCCVRTVQK